MHVPLVALVSVVSRLSCHTINQGLLIRFKTNNNNQRNAQCCALQPQAKPATSSNLRITVAPLCIVRADVRRAHSTQKEI
eukprot:scaffold4419_cov128-Isochrysis_galbana.AAC.4